MRAIFLFVLSLWFMNLSMAQCTGGSISGGNDLICVGTTTGIMTANIIGSVDEWQYSTNGGSSWNYAGSGSSHSDVIMSAGTYNYRVKYTCVASVYYTSSRTILVSNAEAGTITSGGGVLCSGGSANQLSLSGSITAPGAIVYWEYSKNGGAYNLDGLGTNSNPYTPNLSNLGGVGTYEYRAKVTCGSSSPDYSDNTKTYQVNNPTTAAVCNDPDDLRRAVAKVSISGIPYAFSGFLVNHTSQDGRLLFLTSSHPFNRYNPSTAALNSATFTWNEDLVACNSITAATPVTSVGCSILATDGFFTLLELKTAPAMPGGQLYYLGWDINATGSYSSIFQSASSLRKGRVATSGSPTTVGGSFTSGTDNFVESSGSGVFKFSTWTAGNTEKRGRGAPLIAANNKARGVYIGGTEENCGNGPSYFATLSSSNTTLLSFLRDGSETNTATVRMNYCRPSENLFGVLNQSISYSVTGAIVSTQKISDGYTVRYNAGTYVELNDGFVSGNDFIAQIDPCVIIRTTIAPKTDETELEQNQPTESSEVSMVVKIYPTVTASGNTINIEANQDVTEVLVTLYDIHTRVAYQVDLAELNANERQSILMPKLSSGLYFAKVEGHDFSFTQKIIVQ